MKNLGVKYQLIRQEDSFVMCMMLGQLHFARLDRFKIQTKKTTEIFFLYSSAYGATQIRKFSKL